MEESFPVVPNTVLEELLVPFPSLSINRAQSASGNISVIEKDLCDSLLEPKKYFLLIKIG